MPFGVAARIYKLQQMATANSGLIPEYCAIYLLRLEAPNV
jgi:hypothetical protein